MELALRRLPWYLAFAFIVGPLILAPFTLGSSLLWYLAYFIAPFDSWKSVAFVYGLPLSIGFLLWCVRVFFGYFIQFWMDDHLERVESWRMISSLRR